MGIHVSLLPFSESTKNNKEVPSKNTCSSCTCRVYIYINLLWHFRSECHMSKRKGLGFLNLSVQMESSFEGKNWNCLVYILSKTTEIPDFFLSFLSVFKYKRILPENESDFTSRNFQKRKTILWAFIEGSLIAKRKLWPKRGTLMLTLAYMYNALVAYTHTL